MLLAQLKKWHIIWVMPLEVRPITKLAYKLKLTPHLKLSISLLQMPLIKLKEYIEKQVDENPLLEMENLEPLKQENYNVDDEEKKNYLESLITKPVTLAEHLLRQLQMLTTSDRNRKIGGLIIGNIDDDGYLRASVKEIADSAQVNASEVEKVLFLIQTFDPVGVGARNLRECLLIQLKAKEEENSLKWQIVDKYLPFLEKKRYEHIAKKLSAKGRSASGGNISVERIKEALDEITHLEPKPGRSFNTEETIRLIPDAVLKKNKGKYEVVFNDWELPRFTLNDKYKKMLQQKDIPEDTKEYLKVRLKAAQSVISAIEKRKETIQKVTEAIVYIQKDFLDNGKSHFKPMTLSQIANMVDKHKSTISRTVNNKYLQTPHGIFELRHFLSSGIKQKGGKFLSSKAIKSKMKNLINNENKDRPLSDQRIAQFLKQKGMLVSRRAIAKYRKQLKILPSLSRKE